MMLFLSITSTFLGLALLVGAGFAAYYQKSKLSARQPADGEVIELVREIYNPGSSGIYCPVVRFLSPDGEEYEFKSEHGSSPSLYKVGQRVTVLYDPFDPKQAEIRSTIASWLVPAVMAFLGLGFLCGGCFMAIIYVMMINTGG